MREPERILKALANRRRLAIIRLLRQHRELAVGEIAEKIHLSFKSTSRHLSVLRAADIVERDQRGLLVFYCLARQQPSLVRAILHHLRHGV